MRGWVGRWLINGVALLLVAKLVGGIQVGGVFAALVAAAILGLVNAFIRPLLIVLTLPINIVTLGLFTFVVNALMLWLTAGLVPGFNVHGFWAALWGSILLSLVSAGIGWLVRDVRA
ncbi:MAG: phage holin family protein [Bacillota bacterium]